MEKSHLLPCNPCLDRCYIDSILDFTVQGKQNWKSPTLSAFNFQFGEQLWVLAQLARVMMISIIIISIRGETFLFRMQH